MINLLNFDEYGRSKPILDSPRSLQACRRQGIEPQELIIRPIHEMKNIYKDGLNDKKSLSVKLEHYEIKRKNKLTLLRQERQQIIEAPPNIKTQIGKRYDRTIHREVEDKLEKKKIMDEVKEEIKRKQIQLKDLATQQKLQALEQERLERKGMKKQHNKQLQWKKNTNLIHEQIAKQTKVNQWMETKEEKQWKIQQAERKKNQAREQNRKGKEEYYQYKTQQAIQLQKTMQQQKFSKVMSKQEKIQEMHREQQRREQEHRLLVEEEKKKNREWKNTKLREAQIEEDRRKQKIWETIKTKQIVKEEVLSDINRQKSAAKATSEIDKRRKEEKVRGKKEEDEFEIQKRRRIMEIKQQIKMEEDEKRGLDRKAQEAQKIERQKEKERERKLRLEEQDRERQHNARFILERESEKQQLIQEKKKSEKEKEKQKILMKRLRDQEVQEDLKRKELVKAYEKQQQLKQYQQKMRAIEAEKAKKKINTKIHDPNRSQVEQQVKAQLTKNPRNNHQSVKQNYNNNNQTQPEKVQAAKAQSEQKRRLKGEEVRRLIDNLKIQCNKEEFKMMQEEENVEKQRQELEKTADNIGELKRLQKIHGVERARFQEQLKIFIKANQGKVEQYRVSLDSGL